MDKDTKAKRFTLTLPAKVHADLSKMAEQAGLSQKDYIIKCLKLGSIALSIDTNPNKEFFVRDHSGQSEATDTKIMFL